MSGADADLEALAAAVGRRLAARGATLATAESCTGGWIGKALTDVAGSSAWYAGGVVSYSNALKTGLLGVPRALIDGDGAVSEAVAAAMADGARRVTGADVAVAVTGIAGPDGGTAGKPVGTVWLAWSRDGDRRTALKRLDGDREAVRRQSVRCALDGVLDVLGRD